MYKTTNLSLIILLVVAICLAACEKEEVRPAVPKFEIEEPDPEPDPQEELRKFEQSVAADYAIAQTLLNEVLGIPFAQAFKHPEIFLFTGSDRIIIQDRSGCPMTTIAPGQNGDGDTLRMDFGAGCTIDNNGSAGPTVAGEILLISFGDFNSNSNQFIVFDTVTINGHEIIHNFGTGSSGLKFNNVMPFQNPPIYFFEGKVPDLTSFVVKEPDGDRTSIVPSYSPSPFVKVDIVDNDPPLILDFDDFIDARFSIELEELQMSTFRQGGHVDVYRVNRVPGFPIIYEPACRWFTEGKLSFVGTIDQTIDFGIDLDSVGNPVAGTLCDGVLKVMADTSCQIIICP